MSAFTIERISQIKSNETIQNLAHVFFLKTKIVMVHLNQIWGVLNRLYSCGEYRNRFIFLKKQSKFKIALSKISLCLCISCYISAWTYFRRKIFLRGSMQTFAHFYWLCLVSICAPCLVCPWCHYLFPAY